MIFLIKWRMSTGSNFKRYANFGPCLFYQAKNEKKKKYWQVLYKKSGHSGLGPPPSVLPSCYKSVKELNVEN